MNRQDAPEEAGPTPDAASTPEGGTAEVAPEVAPDAASMPDGETAEVAPDGETAEVAPDAASMPDGETADAASTPARRGAVVLAAAIVAIGAFELGAHAVQIRSAPTDEEWARVKAEVTARTKPEDLVVVAPDWVDPLARQQLGGELLTVERVARPDETRFPRAIEVSMRGKHAAALAGWRPSEARTLGPFVVTTYDNPSPVKLVDDLVTHMATGRLHVQRVDAGGATECSRRRSGSQTGNIGFGPGIPADRFDCGGGSFVGVTVLPDLDYVPHRCFFAPPPGGGTVLRVVFDDVRFGRALRGHHAISVHAERDLTGAPVNLVFKVGERVLGRYVHRDGDGWKGFEADTSELAGQTGSLAVEISADNAQNRQYCFEADTR